MNLDFQAAYKRISEIQREKAIALSDIVSRIFLKIVAVQLPAAAMCFIVDEIAMIEVHLAGGATDNVQLAALVGSFKVGIEMAIKV